MQILPFDSFVNPQLYSLLCDAASNSELCEYGNVAQKLVYFNTDRRRAPVAGIYKESCVKTKTFKTICKCVSQNINALEPILSYRFYCEYRCRFFGDMVDETVLEPSLCFNSDYKKLLQHIEAMQKTENYTFGFISTKDGGFDGGTKGHAMIIVANKKNNVVNFTCMNSANLREYWFKISAKRLKKMIKNPSFLKDAIVRYICAIKPPSAIHAEMQELGLEHYPLYVDYYKNKRWTIKQLFGLQKMSLLILLIATLYISHGVIY